MQHGSGNIGATNVARVLGSKKYFFLIFFLDFLKAFLSLNFFKYFFQNYFGTNLLFAAGIVLLLGNSHSVFLKFKGGKGVATTFGILAFFLPVGWFLFFVGCWGFIFIFLKRVDVASLVSLYLVTLFSSIYYLFFVKNNFILLYFLIFICSWVTLRHKSNIKNFFRVKE